MISFHHLFRTLLAIVLVAGSAHATFAASVYVVKRGDTLSSIASRYGVSTSELARANRLKDADQLKRGQKLAVPDKVDAFAKHTVRKGESLAGIAKRYGTSVADIRAYNVLSDPNHITVGSELRILQKTKAATAAPSTPTAPADASSAARPTAPTPAAEVGRDRVLPPAIQALIDSATVSSGRWKNIVVHHSGTSEGSGKGMDRYHREERHMENGLAYHFVIGNGNGMRDGEIFVGKRWREQLDGGHLAIPALNANSLGICLVGDFEKSRPSARQLDALEALCRALMRKTRVTRENVTTHRLIHPKHTQCPGRLFPVATFAKRLAQP